MMADVTNLDDHRLRRTESPKRDDDLKSGLDFHVKADGSTIFYAGVHTWTISRSPEGEILHTKCDDKS
jgi:hypothetical protein